MLNRGLRLHVRLHASGETTTLLGRGCASKQLANLHLHLQTPQCLRPDILCSHALCGNLGLTCGALLNEAEKWSQIELCNGDSEEPERPEPGCRQSHWQSPQPVRSAIQQRAS
jgi:hypothetical protein